MKFAAPSIFWSNRSMQSPGPIDLARRVEEACLNGWPALREVDGTLCVNSVTDAACRRQGLSYRTISALLVWARRRRASDACVPVVATNAPAVALYERLGFRTEMYRYHYRRAATRPS
ncbi:MAG TPA: GNAT family N-acetyltransferase [Stellaceae bacterium]